jgi:hypothetical protein
MCGETGMGQMTHAFRLPLRGQRRLGCRRMPTAFLLPVELRHVNHTASTNPAIVEARRRGPLQFAGMSAPPEIDLLADRVERLLVRHEELQRTNALLLLQVEAITQDRDSLRSRLAAARARVDALLERLPQAKNAA